MMNFITPWERKTMNLFDDFEQNLFSMTLRQSFKPAIRDESDKYVLEAEMPGIPKDDIKIDINGDTLTVAAEHSESKEEKDGKKYIRRERTFGSFSRSYDISNIDSEKIAADYKDGVLILTMPKKTPSVPAARRLAIN
jgi:HSP20 family protein